MSVHDHVKLFGHHIPININVVADRIQSSQEDNFLHWKTNVIDGLVVNNLYHAALLYGANMSCIYKIN